MNREEKLESIKIYLEGLNRVPDEELRQGISVYEFKTVMQIVYELLSEH